MVSLRLFVALFLAVCAVSAQAAEPVNPITFRQVRLGAVVISLPSNLPTLGPDVTLWLHLHGAPAVVEANFAALGAPGVLANLTLPGLSKVYADYFASGAVFEKLVHEVEATLARELPDAPRRLSRVVVSSFSAGFGGVRLLLRQPRAFDRIDALVMADSIYCGYAGDPAAKRVDGELMAGFLRFARLAADGRKRIVISHSQQVPEGYASTTETADFLIRQLDGKRSAVAPPEAWAGGLQLLSRFTRGHCDVLGFAGEAADDHMRHLRAIGALLVRVQ